MTVSHSNGGERPFKNNSSRNPVKDNTIGEKKPEWLGDREYQILKHVHDSGLIRFTLSDVWRDLGIDRRRVHDAAKRLVKRGILRKVARGLYEVVVDLTKILSAPVRRLNGSIPLPHGSVEREAKGVVSQGQAHESRVPRGVHLSGSGVWVVGPRFDNVRGWRGGVWVPGDRGGVLGSGDLVFFDSVSYAELQFWVGGVGVLPEGLLLAVYTNWSQDRGGVRVEVRPPKGFVKRFGVAGLGRLYWEAWLVSVKALLSLAREAPVDVLKRFITWFASQGIGKVMCAAASL